MTIELLQERIGHLETRRQLWQVQGQLLSMLAQHSNVEMSDMQNQLHAMQVAKGNEMGAAWAPTIQEVP